MYNLNPEQQKLVDAPLDHEVVGVAGAGTGKTTTIMARASRILKEYQSGRLLLITFTRLAANDMRERLIKEVGQEQASRVTVGTFHSVIAKIIRQNAEAIGLTDSFSILDEASSSMLYHNAIDSLDDNDFNTLLMYFGKYYKPTAKDKREHYFDLDKLITERSGKEIDNANYKLLISIMSQMVNTAEIKELYTGQFGSETVTRLFSKARGKVFFKNGIKPYTFKNADEFKPVISILYKAFLNSLKLAISTNVLSYDQILFVGYLISKPVEGADNNSILDKYRQNFAYVIVDEYQDTNYLQDYFIDHLTNGNLTVVGDIDQAIYEFRGGTTKLIEQRIAKAKKYSSDNVINLTYNYRSFQPILDVANNVIDHNSIGKDTRKKLQAIRETDSHFDGVTYLVGENELAEARDVLTRIQFMHDVKKIPYKNMVVLVRSRMALGPFKGYAQQLHKQFKIPFNDLTHYADIMESDTMADVLNYLKILVNPRDIYAFLSVLDRPKRGIGQQKVDMLRECAAKHKQTLIEFVLSDNLIDVKNKGQKALYSKIKTFMSVYNELIDRDTKGLITHNNSELKKTVHLILERVGYLKWIKGLKDNAKLESNLQIIETIIDEFETDYATTHSSYSLFDVVNSFLIGVQDMANVQDNNGVVINTIHGVKGLEYDEVFLIGANDSIFPGDKVYTQQQLESERRLMYVALTRARNGLFVYSTKKRLGNDSKPSLFITEMGDVNKIKIKR